MKEQLVKRMLKIGAVKIGKFKLSSGKDSDIYFNVKQAILDKYCLGFIEDMITERIYFERELIGIDSIGADEGVGPSTLLGLIYPKFCTNGFVFRKEARLHGTGSDHEGVIGERILLIEDVVTTGKSIGSLIEKIDDSSSLTSKILGVICVVNRNEGGEEVLKSVRIPLFSLLTRDDFFKSKLSFPKNG